MTTIIRKPKFMRNDRLMANYYDIGCTIMEQAEKTENVDEQLGYTIEAMQIFEKASKAGGFLNAGSMFKWLEKNHRN